MNKVKMTLIGVNGNALSLVGAFNREAKNQGRTDEQVKVVIKKAMSGDYNKLLYTLQSNIDETE